MSTLFTIGYSGISITEFIARLQAERIQCLIDIREIPLSRKRGFSKTALTSELASVGIEYLHLKHLGSPKALRHEVRETREYPKFFDGVNAHLDQQAAKDQLAAAADKALSCRSCLLCFCPDWEFCHRRCVIDSMKQWQFEFNHISIGNVARAA